MLEIKSNLLRGNQKCIKCMSSWNVESPKWTNQKERTEQFAQANVDFELSTSCDDHFTVIFPSTDSF